MRRIIAINCNLIKASCVLSLISFGSYTYAENSNDTLTVTGESSGNYTVDKYTAATKLDLSIKETPQSVSIITPARIQDQNMQSIGDALKNTTGISESSYDSERYTYWSRGYRIDNLSYDGLPTTTGSISSYLDTNMDLSIYDRVEVVRGANGLLTGTGNPSATVNMVRKHAVSREFTGSVSAGVGSWNQYRTTLDVSTPLSEDGDIRGRFITTLQDADSQLDRYSKKNQLFYGVIDANLGTNTVLSIGYDYQKSKPSASTWGGWSYLDSAGNRISWPRSFNTAPNWTHWTATNNRVFITLDHFLDNGWEFKVNSSYSETKADEKLASFSDSPDASTGNVTYTSAKYLSSRRVYSADAYAKGPFELFGREHELVIGTSASRQRNHSYGTDRKKFTVENIYSFNGDVAEPDWGPYNDEGTESIYQRSLYATSRLNLTDQAKLILGGRFTDWRTTGSDSTTQSKVTPYAGIVYDINDYYSLYTSYSGIFSPQTYRNQDGSYLKPLDGKNYEAGVKASTLDDKFTSSFTIFRTEQSNIAVADGSNYVNNSSDQAYVASNKAISKGFEIETNGTLMPGWDVSLGFTRYVMDTADNSSINTQLPRTTVKAFTSFKPVIFNNRLSVGGGLRWQNRTYTDISYNDEDVRINQGSYSLVDLYARYDISDALTAQVNIANLFDKQYYSVLGFYDQGAYGTGRSIFASLTYKF
ncbi:MULTISPECIES: ferric-rhodotorulic acid/ferric-coprogen receptor FhuE [unclassified Pantoea]|uniref:ferric-rhodotorulic acid/ferric-coprogen receptor FhuE n=1 Tax=unclassified Pantoea TaxID=2630326 RepID=UPI00301B9820